MCVPLAFLTGRFDSLTLERRVGLLDDGSGVRRTKTAGSACDLGGLSVFDGASAEI